MALREHGGLASSVPNRSSWAIKRGTAGRQRRTRTCAVTAITLPPPKLCCRAPRTTWPWAAPPLRRSWGAPLQEGAFCYCWHSMTSQSLRRAAEHCHPPYMPLLTTCVFPTLPNSPHLCTQRDVCHPECCNTLLPGHPGRAGARHLHGGWQCCCHMHASTACRKCSPGACAVSGPCMYPSAVVGWPCGSIAMPLYSPATLHPNHGLHCRLQGDGAAIAEATLSYLVRCTRPLTLFITQ